MCIEYELYEKNKCMTMKIATFKKYYNVLKYIKDNPLRSEYEYFIVEVKTIKTRIPDFVIRARMKECKK
jgi:hypothetical protein